MEPPLASVEYCGFYQYIVLIHDDWRDQGNGQLKTAPDKCVANHDIRSGHPHDGLHQTHKDLGKLGTVKTSGHGGGIRRRDVLHGVPWWSNGKCSLSAKFDGHKTAQTQISLNKQSKRLVQMMGVFKLQPGRALQLR
jgi:hypothetical protein